MHGLKTISASWWVHLLLLLLWMAIGAGLRFAYLETKPLWTDEFATLVFSLGHSFEGVPLDRIISLDALLQPLRLQPEVDAGTVVERLLAEDVHPPLYFVLAHWWMKLFPTNEFVSVWAARSLPAGLGVISIPAVFGLGWVAFRSLTVAQLAAAMMAVSPFAIYLSQEARHYTLAILWVIASLIYLAIAARFVERRSSLPIGLCVGWVAVNGLGIATHYFVLLTLVAIAIALLGLGVSQTRQDFSAMLRSHWQRIYTVALGTAMTSLVWVPIWHTIHTSDITEWIRQDEPQSLLTLLNPIFQLLGAWITMLSLLPVETNPLPIVIFFGFVMVIFFVWATPLLKRGLLEQRSHPQTRLGVDVLGGFVLGAIALFFCITYGLGSDLTRGARYSFVYFPAVVVLIGASLAKLWNANGRRFNGGRSAVVLILVMGLVSGMTVAQNLGYQKYYRPDILVPLMQSNRPTLIATTHNTLVQTGEMMGIGWQIHSSRQSLPAPQFLLAHQNSSTCTEACVATATLRNALTEFAAPFDLWLVNFHAPPDLEAQTCTADSHPLPHINGYGVALYHCLGYKV